MLSLERCKKILNKNGNKYTDEEVEKIREFLYTMAMIEYRRWEKMREEKERSDVLQSLQDKRSY